MKFSFRPFSILLFSLLLISFAVAAELPYSWTQKPSLPGSGRHHPASFVIGNRGYVGTGKTDLGMYDDFYCFDPGTNSWTQIANFPVASECVVAFTVGNKAYAGESNGFWEYNPATNVWSSIANIPGGVCNFNDIAFSTSTKGYIFDGGMVNEYNPVNDTWTIVSSSINAPAPVAWPAGYSQNNKGYLIDDSGSLFEFDPANNSWTQLAGYPGSGAGGDYDGYSCFSLGNYGFLGLSGYPHEYNETDWWRYNSLTNIWEQCPDFGGHSRSFGTGFSIGSKGYISCGTCGTNLNDLWEFGNASIGIDESRSNENAVEIFPNPIREQATIHLVSKTIIQNAEIRVFDLSGKLMKIVKDISENNIIISSDDLLNGTYLYQVLVDNKKFAAGKIIVKK